ncbi:hypothetical protein CLV56_3013 [Mumia flava]|uniref:GyrI-like small molecule binding domain-containing protein n=1 Tax=Mumia flava TaxID=1348852 RepID=A0A0B2B3U2_9ACTN|nr:GyrI-like domain-containing protein [Mumia flava]PJJ53523.1 hypothetical protein CLV56_3013 [Mumia flava]
MADKVDFKRSLDSCRAPRGRFVVLDVPPQTYLAIDGHGDPNTPAFVAAVEALYPVAYALKFASKDDLGRDYVVPPLEGLWRADDPAAFTTARDKSRWDWTLMIMVPGWLGPAMVAGAVERARTKGPAARLDDVRLESLDEGTCVQTLHVGAFDDEGAVLARMHDEFIPGEGLAMTGKHHEIYLSDFRRVSVEKRRTILRQPVRPVPTPRGPGE